MFLIKKLSENYQISLKIKIKQKYKIGFIVIWNYNNIVSYGVRNCKIYFQNNKIFDGIINKGNGNLNGEYFTPIIVDK